MIGARQDSMVEGRNCTGVLLSDSMPAGGDLIFGKSFTSISFRTLVRTGAAAGRSHMAHTIQSAR